MKIETRDGRTFDVNPNNVADTFRLGQMVGWEPAGLVCCRLGVANPLGYGRRAELADVRLVRASS